MPRRRFLSQFYDNLLAQYQIHARKRIAFRCVLEAVQSPFVGAMWGLGCNLLHPGIFGLDENATSIFQMRRHVHKDI